MKAPATKDKVKDELATTLNQQMNDHVKEIAEAAADQVIEVWQSFRRAHALVLRLAEQNGEFRAFLDGVKPEALPRLDEVVSILMASEGEGAILKRLQDGSLNAAVHLMPEKGMEIARDLKSIQAGLDWQAISFPLSSITSCTSESSRRISHARLSIASLRYKTEQRSSKLPACRPALAIFSSRSTLTTSMLC